MTHLGAGTRALPRALAAAHDDGMALTGIPGPRSASPSTASTDQAPRSHPVTGVGVQRVLRASAALLATIAAAVGVIRPDVYHRLIPASLLPGAYGQDVVTVLGGLVLLVLTLAPERGPRRELVELGLVGYIVYADGILVIERAYNPLYLVYLAAFALAAWAVVLSVRTVPVRVGPARTWVRLVCAAGALLQPLVFVPLWVVALLPLMAERRQIHSLYSVYILDLGFVMPAFLVAAVLLLRKRSAGWLLAPPMFVLGAVLIGSLAVSTLVGPMFGIPVAAASLVPSVVLAALFAVLAVLSLTAVGFLPSEGAPESS
jgi:hypothetical protein